MPLPLIPLIAAGSALLGQGINAASTGAQNRKSRRFAREMYGRQRADALEDWNLQNEYNSPAAQMARLKAAGLNPNLVYGSGADAQSSGTVRSSGVPGAEFRAPQFHPEDIMSSYYDAKIKQAQYDNLRTQNTVSEQDALLKAAQVIQTTAATGKTRADQASVEFDTMLKNQIKDISVEAARAGLNKTLADTKFTLDSNERAQAQNASSLREAAERILRSRAERSKVPLEKAMIEQQIKNLQKDENLKQLDINLKKNGIQPHDNIFLRMLGQLLDQGFSLEGAKDNLQNRGIPKSLRHLNQDSLVKSWE